MEDTYYNNICMKGMMLWLFPKSVHLLIPSLIHNDWLDPCTADLEWGLGEIVIQRLEYAWKCAFTYFLGKP